VRCAYKNIVIWPELKLVSSEQHMIMMFYINCSYGHKSCVVYVPFGSERFIHYPEVIMMNHGDLRMRMFKHLLCLKWQEVGWKWIAQMKKTSDEVTMTLILMILTGWIVRMMRAWWADGVIGGCSFIRSVSCGRCYWFDLQPVWYVSWAWIKYVT